MKPRRPRTPRRPISAAEVAALAGIEIDTWISAEQRRQASRAQPLDFEPDRGGEWKVREIPRWRRQWRAIRSLPIIVQILLLLAWLEFTVILTFITWLFVGGVVMKDF